MCAQVNFNAAGQAPGPTTGAFTDFAAWGANASSHSIRVSGGDLTMGRWFVAVRADAHWSESAGPPPPDLRFTLRATESLQASKASKEVCAERHASAGEMADTGVTLSCGGDAGNVITAITLSDWSSGPVMRGVGVLASTCNDSSNAKLPICHGPCAADLPARCIGRHSCSLSRILSACGPVNLGALAAHARTTMNTTVCDLKSRTFPTNYSLVLRARRVIARLPPDTYGPLPKLRAHSHQRTQREERKSRVGN